MGIPLACKSIYELATDDEKRKALTQIFTTEGFTTFIDGLSQQALEIKDDPEIRGHFGGQTGVSVLSMFSPTGVISKVGKADELLGIG